MSSRQFEKRLKYPRGVLLRRFDSIPLYFTLRAVSPYTMVWHESLMQMHDLIKRVDSQNIEGSIVETGCWRGGCSAFMAWVSKKNGSNRKTWMFDSFEGLPAPGENDEDFYRHMRVPDVEAFKDALAAPETQAHEIVQKMGVEDQTHIIKGWFKDTLPAHKKEIGKIAILRLDGDLYDSTIDVLNELYDQISPGGYVVIDDYGFEGVRKALYDFFHQRSISPYIEGAPDGKNRRERAYFKV